MSNTERLELLTLYTLELRRLENDIVFTYKIVYNLMDVNCDKKFSYNVMRTREHNLKINVQGSRIICRKCNFINRVVPIWNGLDESVVNSEVYRFLGTFLM